jgi:hypothetical protein
MTRGADRPPPDDAEPAARPVVDVTLIDEMLALTPEERLRQNDRQARLVMELRDGFARARADQSPRGAGRRSG